MSQAKINVQFRLDPDLFAKLEQLARAANTTPGLIARLLVAQALNTKAEHEQMTASLTSQNHTLLELRRDVRISVEAMLIAAGKMEPADAREWVSQNLLQPT